MINNLLNITATGGWQDVSDIQNKGATAISIQARTAVEVRYRWVNAAVPQPTTYWTIKAGAVRTLLGSVHPGELQVYSTAGTIIEVEISSKPKLASGV